MKLKTISLDQKFRGIKGFPTKSFVLVILLMLLNTILSIPITEKLASISFSSMDIEKLDQAIPMMEIMKYIIIIFSIFISTIYLFIGASLLYILCRIFGALLNYWQAMTIFIMASFIYASGEIVNTIILLNKGVECINSLYDTYSIGLNLLTSVSTVGKIEYVLLANINIFQILFVLTIIMGVKLICKIATYKAFLISLLFWIIQIIYLICTVELSLT